MAAQPTVLFVDDEPAIADGHAARLEDRYETLTAYDGQAALEVVDEGIDVIVLDRRMPGLSGDAVLERLRDRGLETPVIMLTGVEPDGDIVDLPYDEYVIKPIDEDELHETVERLATEPLADLDVDADVLDALGDAKTRRCFYALIDEPRDAQELADVTGYSLTTVYRRLNALQQADLIASRTTLDPGGDHYRTFTVVTRRIQIDIDDGVHVAVERTEEQSA